MHAADLCFRQNPTLMLQARQIPPVSPRHARSRKRAGPDRDHGGWYFSDMVNQNASTMHPAAIASSLAALRRR
jgi:hypothetical protein